MTLKPGSNRASSTAICLCNPYKVSSSSTRSTTAAIAATIIALATHDFALSFAAVDATDVNEN